MADVLLDTNAFAWSLQGAGRLTAPAQMAITAAFRIHLCAISIFEIAQKVRIERWPEMAALAPNLVAYAQLQSVTIVSADAAICSAAGAMSWSHKDPFDRMIAATALQIRCPLVSSDKAFDGTVTRIW